MGTVTSLAPTSRDPDRLVVKVDGKRIATLSSQRVAELGLRVGQPWDDSLADALDQAVSMDKAMRDAMRALGRRAQSRRQLDLKLRQKNHPDLARRQALDRLEEIGLIDDEAAARALVQSTLSRKAAGPALLRQKLRQKGIDGKLADRLADEATQDADQQYESALKLARTKLRSMQRLDPVARKRRLYGQLMRRGFNSDLIERVIHAACAE